MLNYLTFGLRPPRFTAFLINLSYILGLPRLQIHKLDLYTIQNSPKRRVLVHSYTLALPQPKSK
jgi:hypothetical protein